MFLFFQNAAFFKNFSVDPGSVGGLCFGSSRHGANVSGGIRFDVRYSGGFASGLEAQTIDMGPNQTDVPGSFGRNFVS